MGSQRHAEEMKQIKIGCSSAFWGDSPFAAKQLLEINEPPLDYIVADYLAELTMGLLARSARSSSSANSARYGYISEFLDLFIAPNIELIAQTKTKIVTNAGGLDPVGLKNAIIAYLEKQGLADRITVAAVAGDDICKRKDALLQDGAFEGFDPISGAGERERGISASQNLLSLNAYIGAQPITEALRRGADIVITGRCVDSAIVVGPLAFELGWQFDPTDSLNLDRLAAASLAGHILECGSQATGGNYTDWRESAFSSSGGWANMGYPILTFYEDASFSISKPPHTGGVVNTKSVCEQMLYEVLDPENYVLPDVVLDMSRVTLHQAAPDTVLVQGARGKPPTPWLKCTAVEQTGFRLSVDIMVCGDEAESKAKVLGKAMIDRTNTLAAQQFPGVKPIAREDFAVHLIGAEHSLGAACHPPPEKREVALRVVARHFSRAVLDILGKESAPFLTNSCPGIFLLTSGRPKSSPNFTATSVLVQREAIVPEVFVGKSVSGVSVPLTARGCRPVTPAPCCWQVFGGIPPAAGHFDARERGSVKLGDIAIARSGDKGDSANVAIIARHPSFYPLLLTQLTPDVVFAAFSHFIAPGGTVSRFEVPGVHAVNFVLTKALGGGGLSSLRLDRQAKSYGQLALAKIHLNMPMEKPKLLAQL